MIEKKDIQQVARLARLDPDEDQVESLLGDFRSILEMFDVLKSAPSEGLESNRFDDGQRRAVRDDALIERVTREEALSQAPKTDGEFFQVPKVISRK